MAETRNGNETPPAEAATTRRVSAGAHSISDVADANDTLGFHPYVQAAVDFLLSGEECVLK